MNNFYIETADKSVTSFSFQRSLIGVISSRTVRPDSVETKDHRTKWNIYYEVRCHKVHEI